MEKHEVLNGQAWVANAKQCKERNTYFVLILITLVKLLNLGLVLVHFNININTEANQYMAKENDPIGIRGGMQMLFTIFPSNVMSLEKFNMSYYSLVFYLLSLNFFINFSSSECWTSSSSSFWLLAGTEIHYRHVFHHFPLSI